MPIVSLLSDFGQKDPYVVQMKAVIFSINPEVQIVDITHQVNKFSITMGAYCLACAAPYFPSKTVHVAVVDPGVGTKRRSIIVETKRSLYVGPDNGLLILAACKEIITHVYGIENPNYILTNVSNTFHGRDIFAPVAAHLTNGIIPSEFGPEITDFVVPDFSAPKIANGEITCKILHIDNFGNTITNVSNIDLEQAGFHSGCSVRVTIHSKRFVVPFCSAYGEVSVSSPLLLVGGNNFLELAVNQGDASTFFGAHVGDTVCFSVVKC